MEQLEARSPGEPLSPADTLLDRYRVVQRMTTGGHSVVYRGEDERLSRPVCIKVYHKLSTRENVLRASYDQFVQEAFTLSRLTHPNILRIYDFGHLPDEDGRELGAPFQVSEFMNGGTLHALVKKQRRLPPRDVAEIVRSLCGALAEAHHSGLVHRDIKPQNILFANAGPAMVPKLADFGIARAVEDALPPHRRQDGDTDVSGGPRVRMFSPSWAAPEQITGHTSTLAVDVYSMALVTVFMLSGRVVFPPDDLHETLHMRSESNLHIESALIDVDVPRAVVDLLERACAYEVHNRPADIAVFAEAFCEAFEMKPKLSKITGQNPRATPPQRLAPAEDRIIAGRQARFVATAREQADVAVSDARLRVTFVPTRGSKYCLSIRGLNCFVALEGGRPTSAVQLESDGAVEIVRPNREPLGRAAIAFGSPAAGHNVFDIGGIAVAVSAEECAPVVALDFGRGSDCLFVYAPARGAPPAEPRHRKKKAKPS